MRAKLVIVGIFYDGYYDIWEDFLELLERYWKNNPYPVYIVNNEKEICFDKKYRITVLHAGKDAEYSRKVQKAINSIEADYYLLLLEDFFLSEQVDNQRIDDIIHKIENNNWKYYRMTIPDFLSKKEIEKPICQIEKKSEYTLSCQPSIWEKNFLMNCIGTENYNAWIFEGIYAFSKEAHSEEFLEGCMLDCSNPLNLRHGYVQGRMLPNVNQLFIKNGYQFKAKRKVMTAEQYKKYRKKQILKNVVPIGVQRIFKKFLKKQSVISKYENEIYEYMNLMGVK